MTAAEKLAAISNYANCAHSYALALQDWHGAAVDPDHVLAHASTVAERFYAGQTNYIPTIKSLWAEMETDARA